MTTTAVRRTLAQHIEAALIAAATRIVTNGYPPLPGDPGWPEEDPPTE